METIKLLNGLQDYITLLSAIADLELKGNLQGDALSKEVSLSYSFITLQIHVKDEERGAQVLYFECVFEIKNDTQELREVYCADDSRTGELEEFIHNHAPVTAFPQTTNFNNYHEDTLRYLTIADTIAKEAYLCTGGDDYRPGYYSEITVLDNSIILRQINLRNAKSIDHKQDYHMRKLVFVIPLNNEKPKMSVNSLMIGDMVVDFSDSSSKNNRECGDRILAGIAAFGARH